GGPAARGGSGGVQAVRPGRGGPSGYPVPPGDERSHGRGAGVGPPAPSGRGAIGPPSWSPGGGGGGGGGGSDGIVEAGPGQEVAAELVGPLLRDPRELAVA